MEEQVTKRCHLGLFLDLPPTCLSANGNVGSDFYEFFWNGPLSLSLSLYIYIYIHTNIFNPLVPLLFFCIGSPWKKMQISWCWLISESFLEGSRQRQECLSEEAQKPTLYWLLFYCLGCNYSPMSDATHTNTPSHTHSHPHTYTPSADVLSCPWTNACKIKKTLNPCSITAFSPGNYNSCLK